MASRSLWRMALKPQSSHAASPGAISDVAAAKSQEAILWRPDLSADERSKALIDLVVSQLEDDKAEDIITINLHGKSDVADAMVIATGRSRRHVGALADLLARALKAEGMDILSIEGLPGCDWVLLDGGDIIVHLFRPEVRDFYNLERIWSEEAHSEPQHPLSN